MSITDIIEEAVENVEDFVQTLPFVNASKIGLDVRAGPVYVDVEGENIIVAGRTNLLEYYGGFEYVEKEAVTKIGRFTVYSSLDERVRTALDCYEESL